MDYTMEDISYESETNNVEIMVVMPSNDVFGKKYIQIPADFGGGSARERRLNRPTVTVQNEKERLLRESDYPEKDFNNYEMVIVGAQNAHTVMDDTNSISSYRSLLCQGRDTYIEIRLRIQEDHVQNQAHPEDFGINVK